jgi:hypothetical protein
MSKAQLVKRCQQELAPHLMQITARCVSELRAIVDGKHPPQTYLLMFVYDSMQFGREFPVRLWRFDRAGREFGNQKLLGDVEATVPEEILSRYQSEDINPDPYRITARLFCEWFADCWLDAGGASCPFPAYLKHHDDTTSYDLKRRRKVEFPGPRFPDE